MASEILFQRLLLPNRHIKVKSDEQVKHNMLNLVVSVS